MHHIVDFGERHTVSTGLANLTKAESMQKWAHGQLREFTMFEGAERYGPSLVDIAENI